MFWDGIRVPQHTGARCRPQNPAIVLYRAPSTSEAGLIAAAEHESRDGVATHQQGQPARRRTSQVKHTGQTCCSWESEAHDCACQACIPHAGPQPTDVKEDR